MEKRRKARRTHTLEKDTVKLYAHMLGMSEEGMRFYEQRGILFPKRDEETGYRVYSGGESIAVITCRKYRRYGLSLETICSLMKEADAAPVLEQMERQRKAMEAEIAEKRKRLESLKGKIAQLQAEKQYTAQYRIVTRPPIYWMKSRENKFIMGSQTDVARTRKWNNLSPYTDTVIVWSLPKLLTGEGNVYAGHIIEQKDAEGLSLVDAHFCPAAKCLYTVNELPEYFHMSATMFNDSLAYMRAHGLTPIGEGVARQTRMYIDELHNYHFISEVWIPIA